MDFIIISTTLVGLGSVLPSRSINICMIQDLHGIMEVTKETIDVDLIVSFVAKIIDDVVVEAGKKIKSTVDGERKRGKKISKVNMTRIPCEDEGC